MIRPKAAIVDMDGTLVDVSSVRHHIVGKPRGEKDFDAFHRESYLCPAIPQALDFCRKHHEAGHVIVVVTARAAQHYMVSKMWLVRHMVTPYDGPIMLRQQGDLRSDDVIKRKTFAYLSRQYNVVAAIDDRPEIVDLWRELQIPEVEVVPGWDFDWSKEDDEDNSK